MGRNFFFLGTVFAFLSVALGAFGAHMLRDRLEPKDMAIFQTGVQYQGLHALALIFAGWLLYSRPELRRLNWTGYLFTIGIVIFSGSLYTLSMTGVKWLGAITPIGGVCFLAGWLTLMAVALSLPADSRS